MTAQVRCAAVFPQGDTLDAQEAQLLREAARAGALLVLCCDDAAEARFSADMPGAYRVVPGEAELLRLCAREGIPQGGVMIIREGRGEMLPPQGRDWRALTGMVIGKIGREIRQRPMDAEKLMCVSGGEKRRLAAACRRADKGGRRLLIASQMAAFDKGSCAYLKKLQASVPDWSILHLSETPALSHRTLQEKLDGAYHRARWAAFPAGYPLRVTGELPAKTAVSPAARAAAENLSRRFPELGENGATALSLYLQALFALALDMYRPHAVMMWNAFTASHMILDALAKARGIPVIYMEFGVLPGTMNFDLRGQMGQSAMAHEAPVSMPQDALDEAAAIADFLAQGRMNRNAQHAGEPGSSVRLPADARPVITFIGQNDYESGICPYDEAARREHSPWYASSMDALRDLAPVCRRLGCTLVYRPHPAMPVDAQQLPEGAVLARGGDLFSLLERSDLTVTLMSQVGYEAMLHGRSVLMLGRCQLSGKGCAWERGAGESLEDAVSRALRGGYTDDRKQAFLHHVAHVARDYAYDDLAPRALRYGRQPEDWAALLKAAAKDHP